MSTPPTVSALPEVPATSDPQFEIKAPALFNAIKNTFVAEVNAVASWINAGSWLTNPLSVASGGSGANTLTGYVKGNGTSAFTASATIPVGDISGTLSVPKGGTGLTTIPTGRLLYGNGTSAVATSAWLTYNGSGFSVGDAATVYGRIQSSIGIGSSIPTLGVGSGHLTLSNGGYGLAMGVTGGGQGWVQAHRFDGTATAYNLLLQPVGGNVGIGSQFPLGRFEARATSGAQGVFSYDASNRFDIFVGSGGSTTCELIGTSKVFQIYGGSSVSIIDSRVTNFDANAYGAVSSYWTEASVRGYIGALKHGSAGNVLFTGETADGFGIRAESVLEFGIGATGIGRWNTTGLAIGSLFNPSAALHVIKTTEQLRLGYDASNYTSLTTDSGGNFTISPTGGGIRINQAPAGAAGAATGTFLTLNLNGTVYKIALLANA